jgi:hypothetical protein
MLVEESGGCCAVCGYDRCIINLHFHHVDPKKKVVSDDHGDWQVDRQVSRGGGEVRARLRQLPWRDRSRIDRESAPRREVHAETAESGLDG